MALRCLNRLKFLNFSVPGRSSVIATVPGRNYHLVASQIGIQSHRRNKLAINYANIRFKYDKKKSQESAVEDEEESDDEDLSDLDKKATIKTKVQSMRADLLLKSGIGIARNKIETAFYENKIRVNGKKITKKSHSCNVGDEIDLIRQDSPVNPNHQVVARIEIVSATPQGENIAVTMRRFKNLTIEKYE